MPAHQMPSTCSRVRWICGRPGQARSRLACHRTHACLFTQELAARSACSQWHHKPASTTQHGSRCLFEAAATAAVLLACSCPAQAADGAALFQSSGCIGCHAGGGNVVQAGASLRTGDLQRNSAASSEAIYDLIYKGKGKMPGYGKECAPKGKCTFAKRLSDDDVQRLTDYVLERAAVDWK